jgi:outer membrane protein assembly factor BamA
MRRYAYIIALFLFTGLPATGDTPPDEAVVDRIVVTGNRTTQEQVILREMYHRIGSFLRPDLLAYERDRIYSLGLFNRVDIHHAVDDDRATIFISVHERWYIFPVPVFGIKDRDWDKLYYGLGIVHHNFRGRNEKLWAGFALGYDPWVSTLYSNPSIFGRDDLFFETQFMYTKTENKSIRSLGSAQSFGEQRYFFDLMFGKRFSLYTTLTASIGYRMLSLSEYVPGHTISEDGTDRYIMPGLHFRYDTRDIAEYPMYGTLVRAQFMKSGIGEGEVDHFRANLDLRRYIPLTGRLSIAGRAFTSIAGGQRLPHYAHVFIGYEEKIRGHYHDVYEGENLFLSSIETRFRLIGPNYIEWDNSIAPEFSVLRYGVNLALFADLGTTWYREDALRDRKPIKGFGGGIHLLLPYSIVARLEYAFDEKMDGELIFDLFVMF